MMFFFWSNPISPIHGEILWRLPAFFRLDVFHVSWNRGRWPWGPWTWTPCWTQSQSWRSASLVFCNGCWGSLNWGHIYRFSSGICWWFWLGMLFRDVVIFGGSRIWALYRFCWFMLVYVRLSNCSSCIVITNEQKRWTKWFGNRSVHKLGHSLAAVNGLGWMRLDWRSKSSQKHLISGWYTIWLWLTVRHGKSLP